jgi:serine/threonine protein kinase
MVFRPFVHSPYPNATVLYSQKENIWKLTDFGLTRDGSSQIAHVTRYSRGSECYRAPELLLGHPYTNKVDIWPLGCILFELVFGSKAFSNDFAAFQYANSGKTFIVPPIPDDLLDEESGNLSLGSSGNYSGPMEVRDHQLGRFATAGNRINQHGRQLPQSCQAYPAHPTGRCLPRIFNLRHKRPLHLRSMSRFQRR